MITEGKNIRSYLKVAAIIFVSDLIISISVWNASPLLVREWNGACEEGTVLVIFYGGSNRHTESRVETAGSYLLSCPVLKSYLVGGARPGEDFYGSEMMMANLVALGIAPERLFAERESFHSVGNIEQMFQFDDTAGHFVFVSDPLHILRLSFEAERNKMRGGQRLSGLIAWPKEDVLASWWRPHFEAAAWILRAVPGQLYEATAKLLRQP